MIYSLFRLCEPFEEITMKRLVTQNFTVIGSILFNPFLGARKLEDDKNYRTLFCQTRRVPTVITDEIYFHTANHEKPVSKSMTAFFRGFRRL